MNIMGYSERGIINSLFYEIRYSSSAESLLEKFISLLQFPFTDNPKMNIKQAEIFIEQSFSDFGDADALMLLSTGKGSASVFIEAKVKTDQRKVWEIEEEYSKFLKGTETKVSSSNLFTQLYHKVRLVEALQQENAITTLKKGLPFPKCSSKSTRKIGDNSVVLKSVKRLKKYVDNTYYVAVLPDSPANIEKFFSGQNFSRDDFNRWQTNNYGYISWADVEKFCRDNKLDNTLNVFKFNEGQIYKK